jgi:hypothetical protein
MDKCISQALDAGKISKEVAQELEKNIDMFVEHMNTGVGVNSRAARKHAIKKTLEQKKIQLAKDKARAASNALKRADNLRQVNAHEDSKAMGLITMLVKDLKGRVASDNVYYKARGLVGGFHSQIADVMNDLRTKKAGLTQDTELARNTVLEIQGKSTGDAVAKKHAQSVTKMFDSVREMSNAAGSDIKRLDNWFPHKWNAERTAAISKEDWVEEMFPLMDRAKMKNDLELPLNDTELRDLLAASYDTITTNGMNKIEAGTMGKRSFANRHQEHRVLLFKDPDMWMKVNDKYGENNFYTTITDHIESMSLEIALLEKMGTNPEVEFRYFMDLARAEEKIRNRGKVKFKDGLDTGFAEAIWSVTTGKVNQAGQPWLGLKLQQARAIQVATDLGSAMLSSIADLPSVAITAKFNGLPVSRVMKKAVKVMASNKQKVQAIRMGLVADAFTSRAGGANRFADINGEDWTTTAADFTLRASGLAPWTDSLRTAYGMVAFEMIADMSSKSYAQLPKSFKAGLKRYDISPEDWNVIRDTGMAKFEGEDYFALTNMTDRTDISADVANKLNAKVQRMINTETDYAVLMPDDRMRAIVTGGRAKGTAGGEIFRNVFMYKTFPMLVIANHLYRGFTQEGLKSRVSYLAQLTVGSIIFGAMALQLKDLSRGRELRDMSTKEFWGAAYMQGGGAGIYGDFLFEDQNRYGGGLWQTLASPMIGTIEDLLKLTVGQVQEMSQGKDTNVGRDISEFVSRHTPVASSLWYTRALLEHGLFETLQKMIDPKAQKSWKRKMKSRKKNYDQGYWWKMGELTPEFMQ